MKHIYKLIFIALLLLGLCVSGVQAEISITPIMTSDTTPAPNSTYATSVYSGTYPAWKAFDGTDAAQYRSVSGVEPVIIGINMSIPSVVTRYRVYPFAENRGFRCWTFDGSNDGITYDILDFQANETQPVATNYTVTTSTPYTYYRWNVTLTSIGGYAYINELNIYGDYYSLPDVSFSATPTTGVNPLTVSFNDTTTSGSPITSYNASLGDGTWWNDTAFPSTNITHVYSTAGNYTVNWYVSNAEGTGSASTTITVWGAVHSAFSLFNAAGTAPHTTYLYDQSTNLTPGPVTYAWDFKDGNTSTSQNVFYTWNATGEYNVTHTVSNGLSSETSFMNVTVGTPTPAVVAPVASFYGSPTTGNVPLTTSFTDVSTNTPTSWNWSFGDGKYSELQNPQHQYTSSGFKTVSLNATNSAGSNVTARLKFVKVS